MINVAGMGVSLARNVSFILARVMRFTLLLSRVSCCRIRNMLTVGVITFMMMVVSRVCCTKLKLSRSMGFLVGVVWVWCCGRGVRYAWLIGWGEGPVCCSVWSLVMVALG